MAEKRRVLVPRSVRLGLFVLVPLLALAAFFWVAIAGRAAPAQAGTPIAGGIALEYVGRIDQTGTNFASYGYISYVNGLDGTVLFTDPANPSAATARMTYYGTGQLTARSIITSPTSSVFILDTTGPITFHFNTNGGANFNNPASFQAGPVIATYTSRNQNIANVQSPNQAIGTNFGDVTQTAATAFSYGGSSYTLGRVGLQLRSFFTGEGTRTSPAAPDSFFVGGGNLSPVGYPTQLPIVTR
jgi:hypothetical protein